MKSGLEDRNNKGEISTLISNMGVSMKSGLEDRNNILVDERTATFLSGLNEVRPGRPEQCRKFSAALFDSDTSQ